jgi:hypothetical protein
MPAVHIHWPYTAYIDTDGERWKTDEFSCFFFELPKQWQPWHVRLLSRIQTREYLTACIDTFHFTRYVTHIYCWRLKGTESPLTHSMGEVTARFMWVMAVSLCGMLQCLHFEKCVVTMQAITLLQRQFHISEVLQCTRTTQTAKRKKIYILKSLHTIQKNVNESSNLQGIVHDF